MAANGAVVRSPVAIPRFHDIQVENINGHKFKLERYAGKILVIVNVASFGENSGKALNQMNELQTKYGDQIAVLGFPCNQFKYSENADGEEILNTLAHVRPGREFYPLFELFSKIEVNGENAHPLYKFLRETLPLPSDDLYSFTADPLDISWRPVCRNDIANNFEKFVIAPNGKPYRRYSSNIQVVNLKNDINHLLELFREHENKRKNTGRADAAER